jgi:hypothetical protein
MRPTGRRRCGQWPAPLLLLCAALALALLTRGARGHAVMIDPQSRSWLDYLENYNYIPHGVNGGGARAAAVFCAVLRGRGWVKGTKAAGSIRSRPKLLFVSTINKTGAKKVGNHGALTWPARNLGSICGDAAGEKIKWDNPGRVTKTYQAGGTATVDIIFAQNHLGRVQLRLCPLDAKDESQCHLLER